MTNWKYICTQLAEYSLLPLNGQYNHAFLARSWASLFDSPPEKHYDPVLMSGNLAVMFTFFMTIANFPNLSDSEKIEKILLLLKTITGGYNPEKIDSILKDGGYKSTTDYGEVGQELNRIWKFHPEILRHCENLFKRGHYSNCINEACKAYNQAVKLKTGSDKDGKSLMLWAFSEKGNLRINAYKTESEINEQDGIMHMSAGIMVGFRNPTAHEPAKSYIVSKEKCVEILSTISLLFRILETAIVI